MPLTKRGNISSIVIGRTGAKVVVYRCGCVGFASDCCSTATSNGLSARSIRRRSLTRRLKLVLVVFCCGSPSLNVCFDVAASSASIRPKAIVGVARRVLVSVLAGGGGGSL